MSVCMYAYMCVRKHICMRLCTDICIICVACCRYACIMRVYVLCCMNVYVEDFVHVCLNVCMIVCVLYATDQYSPNTKKQ